MAVGVQIDFGGMTLRQYDEVVERMGFLPGSPSAPGALFHWVTKTADGIRFIDVWESREVFQKYVQEKTRPVFQAVGFSGSPEIQFFEVHNYLIGARASG